ncbi:MAG: hypothetical protein LRS49_02860 [Desulfurococcales archaeon]|nr:hypothetical protein [Desulfurococcales archaeon]
MALRGCGRYLVATLRVRLDRPLPRLLRLLGEAGARVDFVDEEQRRVTANVPAGSLGALEALAGEYAEYAVVEVKASCRGDAGALLDTLARMGFRVASRRRAWIFTGRWGGRAVEVEVKPPDRVRVKVGAPTSSNPRPPLPPSLYVLPLSEARRALETLDNLIARIAAGSRPV